MGRLLIFANDAASANVTMSYSYLYKDNFNKILAYPNGVAKDIYSQHIDNYIGSSNYTFLCTDTVVLGTSGLDANYEMNILIEAKKSNVQKIIIILDAISNFNMRFSINNKIISEKYLPNEIWVFDNTFKSKYEYINKKFIYKENIYNLFLQKFYKNDLPKINNNFIKIHKNNYLVILTEYIYELYGLKFGFTEYDVVQNILEEVNNVNINIPIFLKLHPRENKNKFNILLRKYNHLDIIQQDCNIQELIYYSKLVFGINSSVFMECSLFNKLTYSIQINSKILIDNDIVIVKSKEQLDTILKDNFTN